ncbi:MAG: hypothetical protein ABIH34_07515 [Nanoarchaeota archaeon]
MGIEAKFDNQDALATATKILTPWVPAGTLKDIAQLTNQPIERLISGSKARGFIFRVHAYHLIELLTPVLQERSSGLFAFESPNYHDPSQNDDLLIHIDKANGLTLCEILTNRQGFRFYTKEAERETKLRKIQAVIVLLGNNQYQQLVSLDEVNRHPSQDGTNSELSDVKVRFYFREQEGRPTLYSPIANPLHYENIDRMKKVMPFPGNVKKQLTQRKPETFQLWVDNYFSN